MKILIVRFSSIGDIVLTSPVIRCLKEQVNNVEIHYLSKKQFLPVLEANPFLSRIYTIEKEITEVVDSLKNEKYDLIIDLHRNIRSLRLKKAIAVPSKSFNKLNLEKWILVNLGVNNLPKIHIVDRYLKTCESLNVKNDLKGLDYFIPSGREAGSGVLPESHQKKYIAIAIGAQHATKRLPVHQLAVLVNNIHFPIVLLGGKEDVASGERIAAIDPDKIINGCGKFDLHGSASLIKMADVVITHDTGLMHIAAAFKKKIISIWGNTVPEFGMYPYLPGEKSEGVMVENKALRCRPCSKIGYQECPKGHFKCMNELDMLKVANEANRLAEH
ncbi:MAG: glycosyltransferase family 9 protein [Flavobacteriales bacterium]